MARGKNIWDGHACDFPGREGFSQPNGRCTLCCNLRKNGGKSCEHLRQEGCALHGTGNQPEECNNDWNCGDVVRYYARKKPWFVEQLVGNIVSLGLEQQLIADETANEVKGKTRELY